MDKLTVSDIGNGIYQAKGHIVALGGMFTTEGMARSVTVEPADRPVNTGTRLFNDNNYHFRYYDDTTGTIDSRGGVTITYRIVDGAGGRTEVYVGCSYCSPSDNYNKRIGRLKAEGTSIKNGIPYTNAFLTPEDMRTLAWQIATTRSNEILQRLHKCGKISDVRFKSLNNNLVLVSKKNNRKVLSFSPVSS